MSWLLELLIEGIREIFSQFIIDMMEIITNMFTELVSSDLDLFEELFSVVGDLYMNVMLPMGIAILLLICVWQLFKTMFGRMGVNSEEPIELVLRSCICLVFIAAARPVINYILDFAGTPYQWVIGTEIKVESFSGYVNALEQAAGLLGIDSLSILVLMLIMQFVVAWNYFKMLFMIAERYVLLGVFSYTAPLAFSTGGAKATNNILASWSKMFGGQVVLIILDAWCMKMFLSGYGNLMASSYGFTKFFVATLCLIGFCKITFKLDTYMASLGINLGRPSSGGSALGTMMAASRIFSKVGDMAGSIGNGTMATESSDGAGSATATVWDTNTMAEGMGSPIPMSNETISEGQNTGNTAANDTGNSKDENTAEMENASHHIPQSMENGGVLDELGMKSEMPQQTNAMETEAGKEVKGVDGESGILSDPGNEIGGIDIEPGIGVDSIGNLESADGFSEIESNLPVVESTDAKGMVPGDFNTGTKLNSENHTNSTAYSSTQDKGEMVGNLGGGRFGNGDTEKNSLEELGGFMMSGEESAISEGIPNAGFNHEIPSTGEKINVPPEDTGGIVVGVQEGSELSESPFGNSRQSVSETRDFLGAGDHSKIEPVQYEKMTDPMGNLNSSQVIHGSEQGYHMGEKRGITQEVPKNRAELKYKQGNKDNR